MKKSVIIIFGVALILVGVGFFLILNNEEYDESIHDEYLNRLINTHEEFEQYINKTGYSFTNVIKSDEKEVLPYNVSSKKYYTYTVFIDVTEQFKSVGRGKQFEMLDDLSDILRDVTVGQGTKYEGHYDSIFLTDDSEGLRNRKTWRMNVNGYPKLLNGQTREKYTLLYYDDDGQPVYSK